MAKSNRKFLTHICVGIDARNMCLTRTSTRDRERKISELAFVSKIGMRY